jgi:hypothetical protein
LGEGRLEFNPAGLTWTCLIRPEHLVDGTAAAAAERAPPAKPPQSAALKQRAS